jgi:glycosyltransferase involved in cell wall biosynthesis
MNIGFIEDTALRGGTQIWVSEAVKLFVEKGENVIVIAPEDSWIAKISAESGAKVYAYDYEEVVSENEDQIDIWTKGLSECDVAVCTVHPPRGNFHCAVFAGKCIKKFGLKTILIPKTGTIVPSYKREFYLPEESIKSTVIAITEFTKKELIETYSIPEDIVQLIYQGTEVKRFTPDNKRKNEAYRRYNLNKNVSPVLGCVGMFEERKGQTILLEAVLELSRTFLPNIHLILVGEGPDEDMLKRKVVEMGLQNNVSFYSFTNEPVYIFERIDILVLSSLYKEGLPNVLLESMSMKVPVVSSKMAGVPEIVKDGINGFMVEPGKVDQLADAINRIWSDQEKYKKMCENGRFLMEKGFDKETQFVRFLEYFYSLK